MSNFVHLHCNAQLTWFWLIYRFERLGTRPLEYSVSYYIVSAFILCLPLSSLLLLFGQWGASSVPFSSMWTLNRSLLLMLAFHDADTDTDTDSPNTATILRPTHAISSRGLGRKIVAVFGESVSVSVSASWNASFTALSSNEFVIKR